MKIFTELNPEKQTIVLTVVTNLFNKYFVNFYNLLKDNTKIPNYEIWRDGNNSVSISIPLNSLPNNSFEIGRINENKSVIKMEGDLLGIRDLCEFIGKFINSAMKHELKNIEFLPLEGYPLEELKKDVEVAVKNKRNFCIIKNFSDYENLSKSGYRLSKIVIDYSTPEYFDIVCSIMEGDLNFLKKTLIPKMEENDWY